MSNNPLSNTISNNTYQASTNHKTYNLSLIDQPKLRYDFVESFAQNELKMRSTAFFILDKLTIFTDVDFSVVIDLYVFNRFIKMKTNTFDHAIEYLINQNYLIWDEYYKKYYVTEKSHVLISYIDSSLTHYKYIPTLHLTDWSKFNQLTVIEQRFLYQLILNTCTDDKATYEFNLGNLSEFYKNNKTTNDEILQNISTYLKKFKEMEFFDWEVITNKQNSMADISRAIIKSSFKLNCLYKLKLLENLSDYYTIECLLRETHYYIDNNLTFPLINDLLNGANNDYPELNTLIKYKQTFLKRISPVNKKDIVTLYNQGLKHYFNRWFYVPCTEIENTFEQKWDDLIPIFLNYHLLPEIGIFIEKVFIKNFSFFTNQRSQFFISANEDKIQLTKNNYQNLLEFFSENANPKNLIYLKYALVKIINTYTQNQQSAQSILKKLTSEHKGFYLIFKNGHDTL